MDRIIIVEEQEHFEILQRKLSPFYAVILCDTVKSAMECIAHDTEGFSCIMINIGIKTGGVLTLLDFMLKGNYFEYMSVAIAIEDFDNIDERIMEYDISEIIQKPYGTYTLAKRLDNIIKLNKQKNELRLSNIELAQAYEKAQRAIEAKSRFLLNTSHDIRTPMNAIIGMTDMAKKYINDKDRAIQCIDNLMTASDHLLNILNDILDMSYIEKDQMSYNIVECSIGNVINELSVIIKQQCDNKGLKYELKIHNLINESVWANPTRLTQMFINILSNSIKYTNSGGVVGLDISERFIDESDYCSYVFRFYDNGNGMSKEFVDNVFVPFAREENVNAPYVEGTGLGMAITKSIIDSMGGTIEVVSKEGIGTQITVVLKFKKAKNQYYYDDDINNACIYVYDINKESGKNIVNVFSSIGVDVYYYDSLTPIFDNIREYNVIIVCLSRMDEDNLDVLLRIKLQMPHIKIIQIESPMYRVSREINIFDDVIAKPFFPLDIFKAVKKILTDTSDLSKVFRFENLRILIVDDNVINRCIMAEILEAVKIETVQAESAREAIELIKKAEKGYFDMILMDLQMPEIDGCEATEIIRNMKEGYHQSVPIVAVTADVFEEDKEKAIKVGMNDFICKPFKKEMLYQCIEKLSQ